MLKTRVTSGLIGLLVLGIVVFAGELTLGVAVFALAILGLFEFYNAISNKGLRPVRIVGYLSALPILFIALNGIKNESFNTLFSFETIFLFMFLLIISLLSFIVFKHDKYNIVDIALTYMGILYIPFLFSFVVLIRGFDRGNLYIWMIFIGAFATDTFAYFSGMLFGKRKLMPKISPKKTVEGSIGGALGCVIIMILFGMYLNNNSVSIPLYHFGVMGLLCGVVSQVGDWSASAVKRYVEVKDYGDIMPGHGGVLDRIDSILFVAPLLYFYIVFFLEKGI